MSPTIPKQLQPHKQAIAHSSHTINTPHSNHSWSFFLPKQVVSDMSMLVWSVLWVGGYIFANQTHLDAIQGALSRSLVQMLLSYIICYKTNSDVTFYDSREYKLINLRSVIMTFHTLGYYWIHFYLPMYAIHTIAAMGSIFVKILSFIIHDHRVKGGQYIAILSCLLGVMFIVNARYILTWLDPGYQFHSQHHYESTQPWIVLVASGLFLLQMLLWAWGVIVTQLPNTSGWDILYHQSAVGVFVFGMLYMTLQKRISMIQMGTACLLSGLPLSIATIIFTVGLSISNNHGKSVLLTQFCIVVSYIISVWRYHEDLNIVCIIGSLMILAGVAYFSVAKEEHDEHH